MRAFGEMVSKKLGHYVYALCDPEISKNLPERVFYIGKGKGDRCFNHAKEEKGQGEQPLREEEHKLSKIRAIREAGREVEVLVVDHNLTEEKAFELEAALIPLVGETNKVKGHGNDLKWISTNKVHELYDRPVERTARDALTGNLLIVSLNKQDIGVLAGDEKAMAVATLGDWNVGELRSKTVDIIIGVKSGLVVSVFETLKNKDGTAIFQRHKAKEKGAHGRSRFEAVRLVALEAKLRDRTITHGEKLLTKIRPGAGCQFYGSISKH